MNPSKEMDGLLKFLQAVERGKEQHPGPYTKKQWEDDLDEEIEEMRDVEGCSGVPYGDCENCYIGSKDNKECLGSLKSYRSEVMDVCVVAFRYGLFLDALIAEKEKSLAGTRG